MKKLLLIVGLAGALFASRSHGSCTPPPTGILSWWRAETNALDSVDGNHGSLVGNTTYGTGKVGKCFVFDGNRDGVNIGTATNLQVTNITVEAWIKRSSTNVGSFNGNGNGHLFSLGTGGGGYAFYVQNDGTLAFGKLQVSEVVSDAKVTDLGWHHVAVTVSGTTVNFYVDGVQYATDEYDSGGFTYAAAGYIGAWLISGVVDNSFYGSIDELAVYGRALTPCEILSIYNAGSDGKCLSPAPSCAAPPVNILSWWRAETNALDSVDGNHGSLAGNTTYGTGKVGKCFVFDGNRDGVNIGTATNLQVTNITVEAWIKRSSTNVGSFNGNGNGHLFSLGTGGGGYAFYVQNDGTLAFGKLQVSEVVSDAKVTDLGWHHVAVTVSGTTVNFYVDGVQYATDEYDSGGFTYAAAGYIGAWLISGVVDNSFYGSIDELAVYGRALTPCEILSIYNAGSDGKCVP